MYEKGFIVNNRTNEKWEFQYNPESLSVGRSAGYSELTSPGIPYPLIQYTNGASNTVNVTVLTRTEYSGQGSTTTNDARSLGYFLDKLLPNVTGSASSMYNKPPTCYVFLGASNLMNFNAVLTDYTIDTDIFSDNLVPLNSKYKLTFKVIL